MILSGEAGIDKKYLGGLSEKPKEEIKAIATAIENGTYDKQTPATAASSSTPAPPCPFTAFLRIQIMLNDRS